MSKNFDQAKFQIDEYVGLSWQPNSDIEFFVYDMRKITEFRSGETIIEYKIARKHRITKELLSPGWTPEEKLYKVNQNLAIIVE